MSQEKNNLSILKFYLIYGLLSGLLASINLIFMLIIGQFAVLTLNLTYIVILGVFIKIHKYYTGKELNLKNSLIGGFIVLYFNFFVLLSISKFTKFTQLSNKEYFGFWFSYTAAITIVFAFIIVPMYKYLRRKSNNNL